MARRSVPIEAPTSFSGKEANPVATYEIQLLTPMLGGGTKSYEPDVHGPVRSQSVKGQLRFWWRTFQVCSDADALRVRENALWGSTTLPSQVTIRILNNGHAKHSPYDADSAEQLYPPYVLFPLALQSNDNIRIVTAHTFSLEVEFPETHRREVEGAVKLWLLFGGIGARVSRGCGSLFCKEVMEELSTTEAITDFVKGVTGGNNGGNDFGSSPWPRLSGGGFYLRSSPHQDAAAAWKRLLDRYGAFRQGRGIGRRHGKGKKPGRTYWPEADALRRITCRYKVHPPVHPAGNWFPRGAYGMPVKFEFRNEPTDPINREFFLQPGKEKFERWPSPVFIKIIKLPDGSLLDACLILNTMLPKPIVIKENAGNLHTLTPVEMPLSHTGKTMDPEAPLRTDEHPYEALVRYLELEEVQI